MIDIVLSDRSLSLAVYRRHYDLLILRNHESTDTIDGIDGYTERMDVLLFTNHLLPILGASGCLAFFNFLQSLDLLDFGNATTVRHFLDFILLFDSFMY